eukprot:UN12193
MGMVKKVSSGEMDLEESMGKMGFGEELKQVMEKSGLDKKN